MNGKIKELQIGIACGINSEKYLEFLLSTMEKTASTESKIEILLAINTNKKRQPDLDYIRSIKTSYPIKIVDINEDARYSNQRHGIALDCLLSAMSSDVGMFCDVDIAFLGKNWDTLMLAKLMGDCVVVGPSYGQKRKYANFPMATFCMFRVQILKKLEISFRPISKYYRDKIRCTEEQAKYFERPLRYRILADVGYQMPMKIKGAGLSGCCMEYLRKEKKTVTKSCTEANDYALDGVQIATHLGRHTRKRFEKDAGTIAWRKDIDTWLSAPQN